MKKTGKSESVELKNLSRSIVERTLQIQLFDLSDEPPLTVPNLEDTIESLLARQKSGLQNQGFTADGERYYPVDPTSLTTAEKIVKVHKQELEKKLKDQLDYIDAKAAERKAAKELKERDDKAFKAWQDAQKGAKLT